MESETKQLRELAASLRKEAAELPLRKDEKIASVIQAVKALSVLKGKLHVR